MFKPKSDNRILIFLWVLDKIVMLILFYIMKGL